MTDAGHSKNDEARDNEESNETLTLWQMMGSALSAAVGVQSSRNRVRDFRQGKASHFIVIGVLFTAVFVVGMIFFVRFILSLAA